MTAPKKAYSPFVRCDRWEEFVQLSKKARIVVYNLGTEEGSFNVYAIKERIFTYIEPFPFPQKTEITKDGSKWKFKSSASDSEKQPKNVSDLVVFSRQPLEKKLECGVSYRVTSKLSREGGRWAIEFKCEIDPETVAEFLSEKLTAPKGGVIEGDIYSF